MKFAQQLEEYQVSAWKEHYIPYEALKKALKDLETSRPSTSAVEGTQQDIKQTVKETSQTGTEEAWYDALERHALHAGRFVDNGINGLREQLKDLTEMGERLTEPVSKGSAHDSQELRFLEALKRVKEGVGHLKCFAEINHAALFKILKKHDKQLSSDYGIKVLFPDLLGRSKLEDMLRFDTLDQEVKQLSLITASVRGLDASSATLEVASLAAGLGRSFAPDADTLGAGVYGGRSHRQEDKLLFFFLGSSCAFFLNVAVFLVLPPEEPETFSLPYFLAPFPVFQVVLAIVLSLWGMGFVARICDSADINHKFLLKIDPRCRVTPGYFFARAAVLSSCWILLFSVYVIDYKWMIFPTINSDSGFSDRSSLHFFFYPAALVVAALIVLLSPSSLCLCKYRLAVLSAVKRTALAPCFAVTFEDNMVGDVLTSLVKPLIMVPRAVCYLVSDHPQTHRSVSKFEDHGNLCPRWERYMLEPAIAALPLIFRAFQCLRRFYDTRQTKHLANLGKYLSSLSVVLFSALLSKKGWVVIIASIVATAYSATWDITMDWGLGLKELKPRMLRSSRNVFDSKRHFEPWVYWSVAVFDILARCTWVQTLMPAGLISSNVAVRECMNGTTAAVEIARRSIWSVLRIEYEQVSNAGQFRTLLWVPSKLTDLSVPPDIFDEAEPPSPAPRITLQSPRSRRRNRKGMNSWDGADKGDERPAVIQIREVTSFEKSQQRASLLAEAR
mmetsp:Transcript_4598/g.8263  ORF Transcript_4598/g.8263 Transcript_4598/m.8263 type:complete len:729 (-) Transcript_4598:89-2275(-)